MLSKYGLAALVVATAASHAFGQAVTTSPNIGLKIPAFNTVNWQVPLNFNLNLIDQIFGGSVAVPAFHVSGPVTFDSTVNAPNLTVTNTQVLNSLGYTPAKTDLSNVPNPSAVLANTFGGAPLASPVFTGVPIVPAPTVGSSPATKTYVDAAVSSAAGATLPTGLVYGTSATAGRTANSADLTTTLGYTPANKAGDTFTGPVVLPGAPTSGSQATTKTYVDSADAANATAAANAQTAATNASSTANAAMPKAGGNFTGAVTAANDSPTGLQVASANFVNAQIAPVAAKANSAVQPASSPSLAGLTISTLTTAGCLQNSTSGAITSAPCATGGGGAAQALTVTGAANGTNKVYTLSNGQTVTFTAAPTSIDYVSAVLYGALASGEVVVVSLNGVQQIAGTDYTLSGTSTASYGSGVTSPPTVAASTGQAATGTALSACQAITTSGTYYLSSNVTCTTQGFAINANNVTLNLNGHTITYGNSSTVVPAISICDTFYTQLPNSACGNSAHAAPVIENGTITQATSSSPFTHAIWIGQGNGITPGTLTNLTINVSQSGAQAIHGDYPQNGWTITNNVINSTVANIQQSGQTALSARSQLQGYTIKLDNGSGSNGTGDTSGPGDTITGNTINGSPQGGITTSNSSSTIAYNTITLNSTYSNDYCVLSSVNGTQITHNTCKGNGRGIDVEASGFTVANNLISDGEQPVNTEYGTCELSGGVGIRLKQYLQPTASPDTNDTYTTVSSSGSTVAAFTNWTISNNSIAINAANCEGYGLALSNQTRGVTGTVANNIFSTSGAQANAPLILHGSANPQITWTSNSFTGDSLVIEDGNGDMYPSGVITVNAGQTWSQLSNGATTFGLFDSNLASPGGDPVPIAELITLGDSIPSPTVTRYSYSNGHVATANYSN